MERSMQGLVLKAVMEPDFRKLLMEDIEGTASKEGVQLSAEDLEALKALKIEDWNAISVKELDARLEAMAAGSRGFTPFKW